MSQKDRAGTRGRLLKVTTNSFEITRLPLCAFYQFDVIIRDLGRKPDSRGKNEGPNFRRRQEIIDRLQTQVAPQNFTPKALYDGTAIMFASHDLKISGGAATFTVGMSDRPQPPGSTRGVFEVRITRAAANAVEPTHVNELIRGGKPTPQTATATNLLQLLIRQNPNKKYPNNGRAYFTNAEILSLGGGIELWRGFFQSVRPTMGRMLVNIDTAMAAVYMSGNIIDVALNIIDSKNVHDLEIGEHSPKFRKLSSFLKNLAIKVNLGNTDRRRRVRGLISNAGKYSFSKDGYNITIEDHFHAAHNMRLKYPGIFGVLVSPKSAENPVIFPAEVCLVLPGQLFKKKIPEELYGKKALDFATMRPADRLKTIQSGVRAGGVVTANGIDGKGLQAPVLEYQESEAITNAGMIISPNPLTIDGRVLETPRIGFLGNTLMQPNSGAWNVMNQKLNNPKPLTSWAVVSFVPGLSLEIARNFARNIAECCTSLGMTVSQPGTINVDCHGSQLERRLTEAGNATYEATREVPQLIIVILPQSAADLRLQVKHWGDVTRGVATQCVREGKIWQRRNYVANNQYCNNVAIKINSRLGGTNFVTTASIIDKLAQSGPFMIVGADVSHPGAGISNRPSIASLVFSYDKNACRYVALSRVQSPRQEMITELKDMMIDALKKYYQLSLNHLPKRIFFFRDGVSEGELGQVEEVEISEINEAIDEAWRQSGSTKGKPLVTFIIVGKRHHVRFFPGPRDGDRKSGNCPAGFVADHGISSAFAKDFYLQSHGGLLGTSRPSHYIVLKDDNFRNMDDIQELAFELCHVYAKATRSVSIPAPVYYADLVCSRANFYFNAELRFADDSTVASGGVPFDLPRWQAGYANIHENLKRKMYFL